MDIYFLHILRYIYYSEGGRIVGEFRDVKSKIYMRYRICATLYNAGSIFTQL